LRNSASCWLLLQEYITTHGSLNVKMLRDVSPVDITQRRQARDTYHYVKWYLA